jgi:hypothetical protein
MSEPVYYSLPAEEVTVGMTTDDAQDVMKAPPPDEDDMIFFEVFTPSDDPAENAENRREAVVRMFHKDTRVDLAVFENTAADGSLHARAVREMTRAQREALKALCVNYDVPFTPHDFAPRFDLPAGWVAGWVGPIHVGCSPEGRIHS